MPNAAAVGTASRPIRSRDLSSTPSCGTWRPQNRLLPRSTPSAPTSPGGPAKALGAGGHSARARAPRSRCLERDPASDPGPPRRHLPWGGGLRPRWRLGGSGRAPRPEDAAPLRSAPRGSGCPRACAQRGHTWRLFSARRGLAFPGAAQGRPSPLTCPTCGPRAQVESLTRLRGSAGAAASPEGSLRPRALSDGGRGPEEAGASTPRTPPASSRVTSFLQIPSGWCAAPARGWGGTRAVREPEPVTREARTCWRGRLVGSHLEMLVTRE